MSRARSLCNLPALVTHPIFFLLSPVFGASCLTSVTICVEYAHPTDTHTQCDVRKPCVLRVAPAPLYNSFCDVFKFVTLLVHVCRDLNGKIFSGNEMGGEEAFVDGEGCLPTSSEDEDSAMTTSSHDLHHIIVVGRSDSSSSASNSSMATSDTHASNSSLSVASSTSSSDSDTDSMNGSNTL